MKRVVVTGMGIWSCIGQDLQTVTESLRQGRSGIIFDPRRIEYGLQSGLVGNVPRPDLKPFLPRKFRATMSKDAEYAYMAARQAFSQAGIDDNYLLQNEVGIIFGNDGNTHQIDSWKVMREEHDSLMLGPSALFQAETSSVTMNLATCFHIKGINITVGAACASGSHAIGLGALLIRNHLQSSIIVGGSYYADKYAAVPRDAHRMHSIQNDEPAVASKPFDINRSGDVPSGGAAALVLEDYDHAVTRGATILAEIVGVGFSCCGITKVQDLNNDAYYKAMSNAIKDAQITPEIIDYVNSIAAGTKEEIEEVKALNRLFRNTKTYVGSTQSITGHEYWMTGASKALYSILMMQNDFIAPNINLSKPYPEACTLNINTDVVHKELKYVLSNASGLAGTNSALVFKKI